MDDVVWPSEVEEQLRFLGYQDACMGSDATLWASVSGFPGGQAWPEVVQVPFGPGIDGFYSGLARVKDAVERFEAKGFERISVMEALFSERPEKVSQTGSWRQNGPVQDYPVFALDIDAADSHAGLSAKLEAEGARPLPSFDEADALLSGFESAVGGIAVVRSGSGGGQILFRGNAWNELRAQQTALLIEEAMGFSVDRAPIQMHGPLRVWGVQRSKPGLEGRRVEAVVTEGTTALTEAVKAVASAVDAACALLQRPRPDWRKVVAGVTERVAAEQEAKAERERAAKAAWARRQGEDDAERPGDRLNAAAGIVEALEARGCAVSVSGRSFRLARSSGRWPADSDGSILDEGVAFFHSPSGASEAGVQEGVCTPFSLLIAACGEDASLAARVIVRCEADGDILSALSWLDSDAEQIEKAFPKQGRRERPAASFARSVLEQPSPVSTSVADKLGPLFP